MNFFFVARMEIAKLLYSIFFVFLNGKLLSIKFVMTQMGNFLIERALFEFPPYHAHIVSDIGYCLFADLYKLFNYKFYNWWVEIKSKMLRKYSDIIVSSILFGIDIEYVINKQLKIHSRENFWIFDNFRWIIETRNRVQWYPLPKTYCCGSVARNKFMIRGYLHTPMHIDLKSMYVIVCIWLNWY